ncbi:MAG TPA: Gfo/Idh/MocA family oxidoreductase [Thermoanaerobaculia bacterium]|jgi:predicted dehydrogenase
MLRWGVLGTARFGDSFVPLIRAAGQRVVAVASRSGERARECAVRWEVERWAASYEALLADPEIDVVYIPLPNALHVEWTLRAVEAGKHVLCEKPLALEAADVDRVAAAASAAGVVVSEAFAYRAHPLTAKLRALVRDGAIGTPRLVKSAYTFMFNREGDVRFDPTLGGGALWDVGCYCVSLARYVLGEEPVEATASQRLGATGVDLSFEGTLRFPSEAVLQFRCSFEAPSDTRTEIIGTGGTIVVEQPFKPHVLSEIVVNGDRVVVPGDDARIDLVRDFVRAITDKTPPAMTLDDSRANAAALAALAEAARVGRVLRIEVAND